MVNYLQLKESGRIEGYDKTTQYHLSWEDLRFPATAINPPGQVSDSDRETSTGLLLFASNATELIYALAQMPHSWKEASNIKPHVHWTKTSSAAGDVAWKLQWMQIRPGAAADGAFNSGNIVTSTVSGTPDNDTDWEHLITAFPDIEMNQLGINYGISHCILFALSRTGGENGDDYGADARLLEFDVHYQVDTLGSEEEFVK